VLDTVAVENYRSLRRLVLPLRGCNVVTGPNGSGKSSLHPDLLPALAALIARSSERSQVVVVTHAAPLVTALRRQQRDVNAIELTKELGQTAIVGQGLLDEPSWHWPARG
jgi:predicted ATPase